MSTLLPTALRQGDQVAVVAPAGAVRDHEALHRGLARLRSWGLQPQLLPSVSSTLDWPEGSPLSADDDRRLADLQRACDDPSLRAVCLARGGYGITRLLDRIDWRGLRAAPKPILGYSDATALQAAAWRQLGLVTFHGPMVATAASLDAGEEGYELQRRMLFGEAEPGTVLPTMPGPRPSALTAGTAEGPLVGGNLSLVCALLGTPWQIDTRGAIVCLEDVGEAPYRIDRMLTQLLATGCLRHAAGIALGDFHHAGTEPSSLHPGTVAVLGERLAPLGIPVALALPFGHRPHAWTLPLGVRARLQVADDGVTLTPLAPATRR